MVAAMLEMMRPPAGLEVDFRRPPGAPALAPADGISWRVFANPVSLFVGGVAAVLLELAEPAVRSGVWDHSSFRRDPLTRLRRTGFAAMVTVYGPRAQAEAAGLGDVLSLWAPTGARSVRLDMGSGPTARAPAARRGMRR